MRLLHALSMMMILITPLPAFGNDTYQLSMLPRYSSEEINRRITPLVEYLKQKTGVAIEGVITSNFAQYEQQLKSGAIEFGYENPYIYTLVAETHEVVAMAVKGKDRNKFRGIIIVRADSRLTDVKELKGKNIAIVGYTSAGGYLSQKLTLMEAGINVETESTVTEAIENKQENVLLSVYTGEADAGFIRESALHQADLYLAASQIRVLSETAWLPNWAFSVKRDLPEKLKKYIQTILINLEPSHSVMKALKIDTFIAATDEDYNIVRQAMGTKGDATLSK
jgi:phosphonate transport system substrate-binding protein